MTFGRLSPFTNRLYETTKQYKAAYHQQYKTNLCIYIIQVHILQKSKKTLRYHVITTCTQFISLKYMGKTLYLFYVSVKLIENKNKIDNF